MKTFIVEDVAWEIYTNGMKSKWVSGRVKNREEFSKCSEYEEYMKMAKELSEYKWGENETKEHISSTEGSGSV